MTSARHRWAIALTLIAVCAGACSAQWWFRPRHAIGTEAALPQPDYRDDRAWLALPQRVDDADMVPPGGGATDRQATAAADVFFIHPTTWLSSKAWNASFDEGDETARRLSRGVLRYQASVFNECCRIHAPRYRQATLAAFLEHGSDAYAAIDLAYNDVRRAFEEFIRNRNQGRPFIVASHSQGSLHALRLLQERIAGTPLMKHLVAAYVIGGSIPVEIERRGLPICSNATQVGCLVGWNTVGAGTVDERRRARGTTWLDGQYQPMSGRPIVCVNPLNWERDGVAVAALNLGALPNPGLDSPLIATVPRLTGAACNNGALVVDIPRDRQTGFRDVLTLAGDYHDFDYNLFYMNLRANAAARVAAFTRTAVSSQAWSPAK